MAYPVVVATETRLNMPWRKASSGAYTPLTHNNPATSSPPPISVDRVARSSGSRQKPCQCPLRMATKYSAKLQLATSMKPTAIASSKGDW